MNYNDLTENQKDDIKTFIVWLEWLTGEGAEVKNSNREFIKNVFHFVRDKTGKAYGQSTLVEYMFLGYYLALLQLSDQ